MSILARFRPSFIAFCAAVLVFTGSAVGWLACKSLDGHVSPPPPLTLPFKAEKEADFFMKKYAGTAAYMTILRLDFQKNTRTPIYRAFNRADVKEAVISRLKGGDGSLPMFIKSDQTNNDVMVDVLEGNSTCNPFTDAGLSRVWPDLAARFTISCRVPIPPTPGVSRGYIVVHFDKEVRPYEQETVKRDLNELAKKIFDLNPK